MSYKLVSCLFKRNELVLKLISAAKLSAKACFRSPFEAQPERVLISFEDVSCYPGYSIKQVEHIPAFMELRCWQRRQLLKNCPNKFMKLKDFLLLGRKLWQHIKKDRHLFANKGLYSQSYDFSSSLVQMWELDHKEGWALKNWTVVLEKTLESPLTARRSNWPILKEISPE